MEKGGSGEEKQVIIEDVREVLILVLMEKGGSDSELTAAIRPMSRLNPCFNGKRRIRLEINAL